MQVYFSIALIIISVALVAAILLQSRGGGLGAFGGDFAGGQYHTRRGLEKTLFQVTIGLSVAFFVIVILDVLFG